MGVAAGHLGQAQPTAQGRGHPGAIDLRGLQQHPNNLALGQTGGHTGRGQTGIRDRLAIDGEGLGGGVQVGDGTTQPVHDGTRLGFDAGGHDPAVGGVQDAVDLDHRAGGQGAQAASQRFVKDGAAGDQHRLAKHLHGGCGGVHGAHRANNLIAQADAQGQGAGRAAVHRTGVQLHHHAQLQLRATAAVAVFVAHAGRRVVKAHPANKDGAKARDGALGIGGGCNGHGSFSGGLAAATTSHEQRRGACSRCCNPDRGPFGERKVQHQKLPVGAATDMATA